MTTVVGVGAQWGDEGKGKIVDWLAPRADLVARFQGGNNAGHTLVVDGEKTVLHIVPSGILHPGSINLIGPGVVVDPGALLVELAALGLCADGRAKILRNFQAARRHIWLVFTMKFSFWFGYAFWLCFFCLFSLLSHVTKQ